MAINNSDFQIFLIHEDKTEYVTKHGHISDFQAHSNPINHIPAIRSLFELTSIDGKMALYIVTRVFYKVKEIANNLFESCAYVALKEYNIFNEDEMEHYNLQKTTW